MNANRSVVALLLLVLFLVAGQNASADHSWNGYHWARTTSTFTLKLGDNVGPAWDSYLRTAASDWSKATVLDTSVVTGLTRPKPCKPTAGRVEVCDANYGNNGWLGLAQIWLDGSHITQGVAKMNDTYFSSATYNKPEWRQFVVCQEIGHTLGLDHQDINFDNTNLGSCMDYTSDPLGPPDNEHPDDHDYAELTSIYTHLDDSSTVFQGVNGTGALNSKQEWGHLLRSSPDRHLEVYELLLDDGRRVHTFVIWAE